MTVFVLAALVCCAILAYRLWRVEERVGSIEDWAEMEHNFITLECDMDGDDEPDE